MRYAHTNIVSKDWKKLAQFYIDVFDCRIKPPQRNLSGKWLDDAVGLTNAKLEGVHLLLPGYDDNGPTLEIFTYAEMEPGGTKMTNGIGFAHIAFEVDDVAHTFDQALQNGATILGKIATKEVEGVGLLTMVYFRDPEGNIVEIQSWD